MAALEQVLMSYNLLLVLLFVFFVLMVILLLTNKSGFNKTFGYEVFVTAPFLLLIGFLVKELFALRQPNSSSTLSSLFGQTAKEPWFIPVVFGATIVSAILGVFMLLYVGGIFSDSPSENNVGMLLNFLVIAAFIIIAGMIYKNSQGQRSPKKDANTPSTVQEFFQMRYMLMFVGFFLMLYLGGIFFNLSSKTDASISMLINILIIAAFVVIAALVYKKSREKDELTLKTLPKTLQEAFQLRTRYTLMFAGFALLIMMLYFVNPGGVMTTYGGPTVFFTLFVGMILVMMITVYQYYLANPSKAAAASEAANKVGPSALGLFGKGLYILAALAISLGLIYGALKMMGVLDQNAANPESWGSIIFNLVLFCAMLGVVYKLANAGGFLDKNPYYRLVVNTLLYIPCLLVNVVSMVVGVTSASSPPKPFEIKLLLLALALLGGYFLWFFVIKGFLKRRYLTQGGKLWIDDPVPTDKLMNVASYESLAGTEEQSKYQYAISFWFYMDSFPPTTGKIAPLVSYGGNPEVSYSSATNTLYVTVKDTAVSVAEAAEAADASTTKEITLDDLAQQQQKKKKKKLSDAIEQIKQVAPLHYEKDVNGNRVLYTHKDVQLQKWNNVVLNYNGGTLDIFYNGALVKSAVGVVPYLKKDMLTAGADDGASGNVANLVYFSHPLDISTIHTLYTSLQNISPPTIQGY